MSPFEGSHSSGLLINPADSTDVSHLTREVMSRYEVGADDHASINTIGAAIIYFTRLTGVLGENNSLDTDKLRKLKTLDLACGNGSDASMFDPAMAMMLGSHRRKMEPWLCRALHEAGADVTGVDLFYPRYEGREGKKEAWKFVQMDLTRPEGLQRHFRDKTFDVVATKHFVMNEIIQGAIRSASLNAPNIIQMSHENPQKYFKLLKDLLSEIRRLLKIDEKALVNAVKLERGEVKELEKVLR